MTGDPEKAEKDFELALQQNADDPDIYYHRAQLHFIKGEFAEAAKDYQKSIDLDPKFIFSHIQLGVTQYKMGSIASSMATFRRCMKNFDKVPDVYNYYGELLLDQGKYQEAIEKFESAIEMEKQEKPTSMNVLPLINKALAIFQEKSDFAEAEKLCQKALISKSSLFVHIPNNFTHAPVTSSFKSLIRQALFSFTSCTISALLPSSPLTHQQSIPNAI